MSESALVKLFEEKTIRFSGDVVNPLFCAIDVANFLEDVNYRKLIKDYDNPTMRVEAKAFSRKSIVTTTFFTERGLYKYLLQSKRPRAEEFQDFVFDLLAKERRRVVDEKLLQAKIDADKVRLELSAMIAENMALRAKNKEVHASNGRLVLALAEAENQTREIRWTLDRPNVLRGYAAGPGGTWRDLAAYYIERINREHERQVIEHDPDFVYDGVDDLPPKIQASVERSFIGGYIDEGYAPFKKLALVAEQARKADKAAKSAKEVKGLVRVP